MGSRKRLSGSFDGLEKEVLPMSKRTIRTLAILSIIATIVFVLAILSLHFLSPEINPLTLGISFYALGSYRALFQFALCILGVGSLALTLAMWSGTGSTAGRVGLVLLAIWAVTNVTAGIFPVDPIGSPPTVSGMIHNYSGMNFLLLIPATILAELDRMRTTGPSPARSLGMLLAIAILIAAILLFAFNGPLYGLGIGGAVQRLYWIPVILWLLYAAAMGLNQVHDEALSTTSELV
jgi:hypothetical protein